MQPSPVKTRGQDPRIGLPNRRHRRRLVCGEDQDQNHVGEGKTGYLQKGDHLPDGDAEAVHDSADDRVPEEGADGTAVEQRVLRNGQSLDIIATRRSSCGISPPTRGRVLSR